MSTYQDHNPTSGAGEYLKLKDGDRVKMRIASEPAISVYKEGDRPRYSWTIYNRDNKKVQIYSAGVSVFKQIAALVEDWGEPTEFDIRIARSGSGMNDTEYIVTPVKESKELAEEIAEEVSKIDLPKAIKGKWLREYVEDNVLPAPIESADLMTRADTIPGDEDAPINLDDIPFN
jgi:hypothetical protein